MNDVTRACSGTKHAHYALWQQVSPLMSLLSLFIFNALLNYKFLSIDLMQSLNFLELKFFFLAIIFSLMAQVGDLTISFFKRLENRIGCNSVLIIIISSHKI